MLRRMWRAFWAAMREPVKRYAPDQTLMVRFEVDSEEAMERINALLAKAGELKALDDSLKHTRTH